MESSVVCEAKEADLSLRPSVEPQVVVEVSEVEGSLESSGWFKTSGFKLGSLPWKSAPNPSTSATPVQATGSQLLTPTLHSCSDVSGTSEKRSSAPYGSKLPLAAMKSKISTLSASASSLLSRGDDWPKSDLSWLRGSASHSGSRSSSQSATPTPSGELEDQIDADLQRILAEMDIRNSEHLSADDSAIGDDTAVDSLFDSVSLTGHRTADGSDQPKSAETRRTKATSTDSGLFEAYDWRVIVFVRHGKSRWNTAADGSMISKAAASAQGFWELAKHKVAKKMPETESKSEIMDAPLSFEGILEALSLADLLREHMCAAFYSEYCDAITAALSHLHSSLCVAGASDERLQRAALERLRKCTSTLRTHADHWQSTLPSVLFTHKWLRAMHTSPLAPLFTDSALESALCKTKEDTVELSGSGGVVSMMSPIAEGASMRVPVAVPLTAEASVFESFAEDGVGVGDDFRKHWDDDNEEREFGNGPMSAQFVARLLNGEVAHCGVVCSNLRRAISTALIALNRRLRASAEMVSVLSCLQEVGLNADTRPSIAAGGTRPVAAKANCECTALKHRGVDLNTLYGERLDMSLYKGDFSDRKAAVRLLEFVEWVFGQRKYRRVVAFGHSHWFQLFFRAFIPSYLVADSALPAPIRQRKLRNCAAVAFKMVKYTAKKSAAKSRYFIVPKSVTPLSPDTCERPKGRMKKRPMAAATETTTEDASESEANEESDDGLNDADLTDIISSIPKKVVKKASQRWELEELSQPWRSGESVDHSPVETSDSQAHATGDSFGIGDVDWIQLSDYRPQTAETDPKVADKK